MIYANPAILVAHRWSSFLEIFLDCFGPRNDWPQRKLDFIMPFHADLMVAAHENIWFKFKLRFFGFKLAPIHPVEYFEEKQQYLLMKANSLGISPIW